MYNGNSFGNLVIDLGLLTGSNTDGIGGRLVGLFVNLTFIKIACTNSRIFYLFCSLNLGILCDSVVLFQSLCWDLVLDFYAAKQVCPILYCLNASLFDGRKVLMQSCKYL